MKYFCPKLTANTNYRNIRETPPPSCFGLLLTHPLYYQPPPSYPEGDFSTPSSYCRRCWVRRTDRPLRLPSPPCTSNQNPRASYHSDKPRSRGCCKTGTECQFRALFPWSSENCPLRPLHGSSPYSYEDILCSFRALDLCSY